MRTTSTHVCRPGAVGTRRSATLAGSTRAMRMATVSERSTSTQWRGRGPCYAPGCGHTGALRRKRCHCISASSSSCTTPAAEAKLLLAPPSRLWPCDAPPSPQNPTRAAGNYHYQCRQRPETARAKFDQGYSFEISLTLQQCVRYCRDGSDRQTERKHTDDGGQARFATEL